MSKLSKTEVEIQEKLLEVRKLILEIEELSRGSCINVISELFTSKEVEDAYYHRPSSTWNSSSDDC